MDLLIIIIMSVRHPKRIFMVHMCRGAHFEHNWRHWHLFFIMVLMCKDVKSIVANALVTYLDVKELVMS